MVKQDKALQKFLRGAGRIIFDIPKKERKKYFEAASTTTNFDFLDKGKEKKKK